MRRLAALALLVLIPPARAERLPIRTYGAGEGLAGDLVRCVLQDSRGFLWLATNAGVSRFDGATFTNFGAADGIPFGSARKVVEAPDGALYVVARGRVVRFDPSPAPGGKAFSPLAPPDMARWVGDVLDLAVAPDGALVLVGTKGAARLQGGAVRRIDLGPSATGDDWETAWGAAFDAGGALWVARTFVVTRIAPGGEVTTFPVPSGQAISSGWGWLPSMVADRRRGVWVLLTTELWHLTADPSGRPVREEVIAQITGLPSMLPRAMHETPGGTLWIGTPDHGLIRGEGVAGARRFTKIGTHEGLPDSEVTALASDAQGNLWAGTGVAGLVRVAAEGMTSWGAADGLTPVTVQALQDDPEEGLLVILADLHFVSIKAGRVVHRWTPAPPLAPNWGEKQLLARGRDGRLWLATGVGLAMYPPGTNVRDFATGKPERIFDTGHGLPGNGIQRLFVASDGTVWFGIMHAEKGLCRMDGQGNGLRCFGVQDGLPPDAAAVAFGEDRGGGIWFGLWNGGLFRHRQERLESWPETVDSVQTGVSSIRRDASGDLWVSGAPGLLRVEDAASPHPRFRRLSGEQGISSPETTDTAEDPAGRLYVGSAHGLARVDLATGAVRRFTIADGLPSNRVTSLQWDGDGALWIGTSRGVARLVPRAGTPRVPPRVFLTGVTVAGTRRDPQAPLALGADERTIEFAFTSPSFRAAETMRFQWRLLDTSDAWSPPGTSRSVVFAGLSPGKHRFEVRTVDGEGQVSTPVATEFSIRPPLWRRGWFLGLVALTLAGAIAAVHRTRVRRLLEVERVRTRIATDLHDDVAASLSQIAVLSQTASRQAARGSAEAEGSLERITDLSGSVVDAMSDVVWSINPARDRVSDLVHRMRRFAVDLFSEADAELHLELPEDADDARIDSEVRRQVYLVFKESLRNAVRHAAATRVEVSLHRQGRGLFLTVRDNGRGLGDARATDTGFGLQNMRRRAEVIGATLAIRPVSGGGTEVVLAMGTD